MKTRRGSVALSMSGFGGFAKSKDSFKYTGTQRPSITTPMRKVPKDIVKPDYWSDGKPKAKSLGMPWDIPVNSAEDIEGIRKAARAAREVLDIATSSVRVGMTTEQIDELVHEETIKRGGYPSPLNYHGFPKSVCTSINEVVCHGIPGMPFFIEQAFNLHLLYLYTLTESPRVCAPRSIKSCATPFLVFDSYTFMHMCVCTSINQVMCHAIPGI
jgi:hypothetical protein